VGRNNARNFHRRALSLAIHPCVLTPYEANFHIPRRIVQTMTPLAQRMIGWRTANIPPPFDIGMWTLNMQELGEQMGLKSNQPLDGEKEHTPIVPDDKELP
jgi:verruculogen synthase